MGLKRSTMWHLEKLLARRPELAVVRELIAQAAEMMCRSHLAGGKMLVCGNGGSAADSEHLVAELMKGFLLPRRLADSDFRRLREAGLPDWQQFAQRLQKGVPALALGSNSALTTAILNDIHPEMVFAQQVYVLGRPGDVLIGLSTSGAARNVLNALKVARAFGLPTLGLTGSRPAPMDDYCDVLIKVPAEETSQAQELHLPVYHTLCVMVEQELFGSEE